MMRTQARATSIVVLGVLSALAGACQKSGDALLYVTVTASPPLKDVETVDVTVTKVADAAPRTAGPLHYHPDGGVDIGASGETLSVTIPGSAGPVTVTVVARGASGDELGRGTSSAVEPHGGSITNVTVKLGSSEPSDGGTSDGAEDGAIADAAGGTSGAAGSAGTGGNGGTGTGGAGGGAGVAGAGGAGNGGGGAGGTGGVPSGVAGAGGTGGAAGSTGCVPRARDCTSSNDNDCNGKADNTETTFCQCSLNDSPQSCSTGLMGICKAGSQKCIVSADKTTSAWEACVQLKAKGTETCANPGTDDDCDGVVDNVPTTACNVGTGMGACANGGLTACNGTTAVCNPSVSAIGDTTSTAWHLNPAPNGSWDWNCDGVVTKQYPDAAPPVPNCTGLAMPLCTGVAPLYYALNPFACGDLGDIGSEYCIWMTSAGFCTNKTGQSTGYQQGCR
jgi:hypothetical protein